MNPKHIKSGTVREDGKVFWRYHPNCKDGEHWVSAEQYQIWRTLASTRARNHYRKVKGSTSQDFSARRAEAAQRYRSRAKVRDKYHTLSSNPFKDRTDAFSVKSFVQRMMLEDVPPLPDLRPDQLAMIPVVQSSDWWREKANSNYPYLPPEG